MTFAERVRNTPAKTWDLVIPHGDCGIEIEVEGDALPQGGITRQFIGKGDGSLRNGAEYVSSVLGRREVGTEVNRLRIQLEKAGARFQPSYRCSTHIHENYANRTFHDVLGAYVVWALIEPTVFRAIPAGRDGSLFCVPSYDSGDIPAFIDRFCKDIAGGFRNGFRPRGKYASLNVTRLGPGEHHALGTLEYRIFPYTMDGDTIQQWCDWLGGIKAVVAEQKDETFLGLVRWAEQNPKDFIQNVFGGFPIDEKDLPSLVDFGARQAYEIARVVNAAYRMKATKAGPKLKKDVGRIGDEAVMAILDDFVEVAPAQPVPPFPARNQEPVGEARPVRRRAARPARWGV